MKKNKLKYLLDIIVYTILPKLSTISFFFVLPLVSRDLTLNDYAIFGVISAYLLIFQFLVIIGQNVILQNSFFEYKKHFGLVWSRSFGLMSLSALICSALISLLLYITLGDQLGGNLIVVCGSIIVFLMLSPMDTIASTYFVLKERSLTYSLITLSSGIVSVLVFYYVVSILKLGYLGWIFMWPCGAVVSFFFFQILLYKEQKIFPNIFSKLSFKKSALRRGAPLIPHQLSLMILSSSDRLILQMHGVSTKSIGLYSQGYTIGAYGQYLVNGFFQAFTRRLQEAIREIDVKENQLYLKRFIFNSCLIISLILFFSSLYMKEFFDFFFSKPELKNGYFVSYVILCSYMFWPLYTYFTYPLLIFNKTKEVFYISGLAAGINIVGNLILIPFFEIYAALYMTYFSMIVFGLIGLLNKTNRVFFSKVLNIKNFVALISLLNLSLLFLSSLILEYQTSIKIVFSIIFAALILLILKKLNSKLLLETSFL